MIRLVGDRVLVALPPTVDEIVTDSGLVLVKDPDRFHTPTRGIVVALGEKTGTVDLDDVRAEVAEYFRTERWGDEHLDNMGAILDAWIAKLGPAPFDVAVNDCVLFSQSAGEEIEDAGIRYVILREAEILGVLEPKASAA